jgi:ABC-type proline/glycine betaine transport system ATPase subunit
MQNLLDIRGDTDTTVIIVTHDMAVASRMGRVITLIDGRIAEDVDARASAQMAAVQLLKDKRATGEMPLLMLEEVSSSDMTANEKMLDDARELILRKRYDEARQILEIMTQNETAQKWLAQLDQIAPKG